MVNNSINIIKTKESLNSEWSTIPSISSKQKKGLNSDGQEFHQYHQNKRQFKTVMVNNSIINIIKTKESLSSDGQQFHQYYQNKRKVKQWWSTIPLISSKQKKV